MTIQAVTSLLSSKGFLSPRAARFDFLGDDKIVFMGALPYSENEPENALGSTRPQGRIAPFARRNYYRAGVLELKKIISFPYKGFYEKADARREADRLEKRGLDVWIRRVDGFSTLGLLSDPIYSFMTDYSLYALADLIIHEQTHATIFIKNQIQFNEELATFVGREGALTFLRDRYGTDSSAYTQALAGLEDWRVFGDRMIDLHDQLKRLYSLEAERETALAEKHRIVGQFNRRLITEAPELFRTDRFRSFKGIPANNAYIMSFVRYNQDLELFYSLYEANGRDIRSTVDVLKRLKKTKRPPKQALKQLIAE